MDPYVKMAQREGYRARAAYKLKEIDDKNIFEKDDDVGFVFSEIVKLIELIKEKSK